MRRFLSFISAFALCLTVFAQDKDALRYWNDVLDRYELLCDACLEHKSTKEVKNRTAALQEILKNPIGKMTAEQQRRFTDIQKRYKGISEDMPTIAEKPLNIVKVDTVRRVEHVKVIDTVFVKEILGEVAILQQMSRRDTVVHIIRQEDAVPQVTHAPDTVYIERVSQPARKVKNDMAVYILAEAGICPKPAFGAMVAIGNRLGGYVKVLDSFQHPSTSARCTSEDNVWTTGMVERGRTSITAGGMAQVLPWFHLYAGAGYGSHELAWEDAKGEWLYVEDGSGKGPALDFGVLCHYGSLAFSCGVNCTNGVTDIGFGFGVRF